MAVRSNTQTSEQSNSRVVFLDYLRVFACFMVMLVHCCEPFYLGGDGVLVKNALDFWSVNLVDSACRAAVPLFVMCSAYLLFPVTRPTGEFFRRRLLRVVVPFAVWSVVYCWRFGGNWTQLLFNFPIDTMGGHLWFVPMLVGLYLLMPLLSPWAERVREKELRGWLALWLVTALFPYARKIAAHFLGAPSYGVTQFIWGECPWNSFGAFHYVSGFVGYLLLGLWFRKFAPAWTWRQTLARAVPLWTVGWTIAVVAFWLRRPLGEYPLTAPYAKAVDMETGWEFCSLGVAFTVTAYFLVLRKCDFTGALYQLVRPFSEASYGTYLVHILVLVPTVEFLRTVLPTPAVIFVGAVAVFLMSSCVSMALRKIPKIGRFFG